MSNAALCATSTVSCAKAWNAGSTAPMRRLAGAPSPGVMPWIGIDAAGIAPPRVDELVEALLPQQPAVDDARRADLDDLVAGRRRQARGLGVEHGVGQLGQRAVVELARSAPARGEQVEVVVLGPAVAVQAAARPRAAPGRRPAAAGSGRRPRGAPARARTTARRRGARPRRAPSAPACSPPMRIGSVSQLDDGLGAHGLPGPHQVELGARPGAAPGAAASELDLVLVDQPRRPGRPAPAAANSCPPAATARASTSPARRGSRSLRSMRRSRRGDQVGAQHVLERPARLQRRATARGEVARCAGSSRATSSRITPRKRSRIAALDVGVVEHLDRRLHVAQRRAAALGQAVQQLVARATRPRSRA